jgi:DNA-binding winged helix-turn-helix (wHTH) protein/TolB-like protein/Flp pilus assembly protein TadD
MLSPYPVRDIAVDDAPPTRLWIGDWCADPYTNELLRDAERVRVEPKAMDVLVALAQRAGTVVTRDELLARVWPGVVVGDEAVTQSIIKLRRALRDDSRAPAYIETIAKRGYRLIAPVRDAPACDAPSARPAAPSTGARAHAAGASSPRAGPTPARRRRPLAALLAGAAITLVVALVAVLPGESPGPAAPVVDTQDPARAPWVTVTVRPFEYVGPGREHAYLARGIGDDLAADLSRLSALRVIRESEAAGQAGPASARYRISGSVQRDAALLRISVELGDTRTHEVLWTGRFERPLGDLFAVQDEMTARLVALLPAKVSEIERRRLARRYTRSLEAYDRFLRGQALFLVRGARENEAARRHYREAIELDPGFARAYSGLAMTYAMDDRLRPSADRLHVLDRAAELAESGRQIDPDLPHVHWALGFVEAQARRHERAIASLQQAIELDPSFADAYALLGGIYTYTGEPARSIPLLRTALRLNPDGGYLYYLLLGRAFFFRNDVDQALINLRAAAQRNPVDLETRVYLAAALLAAGDAPGAGWEADEVRALQPGFATRAWLESYPMTSAPQKERLAALLAQVNL